MKICTTLIELITNNCNPCLIIVFNLFKRLGLNGSVIEIYKRKMLAWTNKMSDRQNNLLNLCCPCIKTLHVYISWAFEYKTDCEISVRPCCKSRYKQDLSANRIACVTASCPSHKIVCRKTSKYYPTNADVKVTRIAHCTFEQVYLN